MIRLNSEMKPTAWFNDFLDSASMVHKKLRHHTPRQILNTFINIVESRLSLPVLYSLPQTVDIALTRQCNLACVYCKEYPTRGAKQISVDNFRKAAHMLFPTARQLTICTGGEPYLHRHLEDFLRIARGYRVQTLVLSNGMLLKEERIKSIVSEELITIHGFSVDGISPATVEGIRRNVKLQRVLENINMLMRVRNIQKKRKPVIVVRYVLMRSTVEELPEAVHYWGRMGIEELACNYLHRTNNIDRSESLYFHQDLTEQVFAEACQVARNYPQLTLTLPPLIRQRRGISNRLVSCRSPWDFVFVDTDGAVAPCYSSTGICMMGNLFAEEGGFRRIWNNSRYQDLRRTTNDDRAKKHFSYCSVCQSRCGWGDIAVHLGDEVWFQHIDVDEETRRRIVADRHRKPVRRMPSIRQDNGKRSDQPLGS